MKNKIKVTNKFLQQSLVGILILQQEFGNILKDTSLKVKIVNGDNIIVENKDEREDNK